MFSMCLENGWKHKHFVCEAEIVPRECDMLTIDPLDTIVDESTLLQAEVREELNRLTTYAHRGDSLAVASVAYRLRNRAEKAGLELVYRGATRIEESARRNNIAQFSSEIDLLEYQVRWLTQTHERSL
jgi:hypothetical protein